jgi:hypothetical protein
MRRHVAIASAWWPATCQATRKLVVYFGDAAEHLRAARPNNRVGWSAVEIEAWIEARKAER